MGFKGQLWRDVWSLCRCFLFAVLPTNSMKHPHTWEPWPRTRHRSCFAEVSNSMLSCLVLVTRCDGSIDISAVHCPRRQVFTVHLSWVVSRMCECSMSVHSRTVNVLLNKRLSIVLHNCRFSSRILSFGIQTCLKLAESSAQSSSQSEDDDTEFIKMHTSGRR